MTASSYSVRRFLPLLLAVVFGFGAAFYLMKHGYFGEQVHTATLVDGGTYTGELKDGKLYGQGSIEWIEGSRYEGAFKEGLMHGQGVYEDAFGNRYEGQFIDGRFSGKGEIRSEDGGVYVGETRNWLMHGKGKYTEQETEYRGSFVDGQINGHGEYYEEGELRYRGEFQDWMYQGSGELFSEDGVYKGKFEQQSLVEGTFDSADGEHYEGEFTYTYPQGDGVLTLANGDRYEGEFRMGEFHGSGTMYLAEAKEGVTQYSGKWRHGRLVASEQSAFVEDYSAAVEHALYRENTLLEDALAQVARGDPKLAEVYFLGIAGDGTQRVFSREIGAFRDYLANQEPLQSREVVLVNDRNRIAERPMATLTSIRRALNMLGERMNVDQDLLVIYLSSHGSKSHNLSLKNESLSLADLPATELAAMLRDAGIRWQVIVVSACYSGGFIDPLRSEYNLIVTAAAADKTSFGCSDEAQMTYFGQALLDSLAVGGGAEDVFNRLHKAISAREDEEDLDASDPQFYLGSALAKKLRAGDFAIFATAAMRAETPGASNIQ